MRVRLRPSVAADFVALLGQAPVHRVRALTAVLGELVLGIGGFIIIEGDVWASVAMSDEARRFPFAIHRAGKLAMQMARDLGYRRVFAKAEDGLHGADRWLEALGFVRSESGVFVWQPHHS